MAKRIPMGQEARRRAAQAKERRDKAGKALIVVAALVAVALAVFQLLSG